MVYNCEERNKKQEKGGGGQPCTFIAEVCKCVHVCVCNGLFVINNIFLHDDSRDDVVMRNTYLTPALSYFLAIQSLCS